MADINKAIKPVESVRIAPLNDGSLYQANKEIKFRLGAGLDMFLVAKSYLQFDLACKGKEWTNVLRTGSTTRMNVFPSYIKNACNIFRTIEVYYGGDCIYTTKTQNIENNTIRMMEWGDNYLDKNWSIYTTTNMIKNKTAFLKLENAHRRKGADGADALTAVRDDQTIYNIQIPLNQLLPFWMNVGPDGFPMRSLNQQIEIRLYVADPYLYLVDYNNDNGINDFTYDRLDFTLDGDTNAIQWNETNVSANKLNKMKTRFENSDVTLENVYIYANYYTPDANEAAIIDDKCANGSYSLKYDLWDFDERQIDKIQQSNNLPFSVVTSNTKAILCYCFRKQTSPSIHYRPYLNNFQLKFTPHVSPLQPISGTTMGTPHEYKYAIDDVFNALDTYYTDTNSDFDRCYQFEEDTVRGSSATKPSSSFIIYGMNYTSDPTDIGADSSDWNSQYQMNFNGPSTSTTTEDGGTIADETTSKYGLQFVIAVKEAAGLIIKNNKIFTFTL